MGQQQQFASLGDFRLHSGEAIRNCKIGYRTMGQLNSAKSNAVLFPTYAGGTSKDLIRYVGPGKFVDSAKYFVILADSFGDGVTSSPSNSTLQPHMHFPKFTIRDIVESEHDLVAKALGIPHLHAVVGISFGGMQTFQWVVSYPTFMDKAVTMVGSPQSTSYDLLLWQASIDAIEEDPAWRAGDYTSPPMAAIKTWAAIHTLAITTPEYRITHTSREEFPRLLETSEREMLQECDLNDGIRQAQAMMDLDVSAPFGGSMERAASAVRAEVMIIVGTRDHMVNPRPALDFAKLLKVPAVELDSDCGHLSFSCEMERLVPMIDRFLGK
jgi:homoserine O-acetyltransferase